MLQVKDRIAGLQDLQDRGMGLAGGCLDRITGLQDLQDRVLMLSWAQTMDRMAGFTGRRAGA